MDKKTNYSIKDMLSKDEIKISIRITVTDFPINEVLEYHNEGKWSEDISTISRTYNDSKIQHSWANFQTRLLSFLDDGNMRVIMDIMGKNDEYYSNKYNLKIVVENLEYL